MGGPTTDRTILASSAGAVLLGLVYLFLADAPSRLALMNLSALGIGLSLVALARLAPPLGKRLRGALLCSVGLALIATALLGSSVEGASRWVSVAGLAVQPSLILVPPLLLAHAVRPGRASDIAVALTALAMALQPDRSIAAIIAAATMVVAWHRPTRSALFLAAWSLAALAVTLVRPDQLPAIAYVDQILWTGFSVHPVAGLALWAGSALLLLPALLLARRGERPAALVFAMVWGGAILSAALGNYPTPLVGYGASPILGYLLTAIALIRVKGPAGLAREAAGRPRGGQDGSTLRFA